jgi:hypothetical protein
MFGGYSYQRTDTNGNKLTIKNLKFIHDPPLPHSPSPPKLLITFSKIHNLATKQMSRYFSPKNKLKEIKCKQRETAFIPILSCRTASAIMNFHCQCIWCWNALLQFPTWTLENPVFRKYDFLKWKIV